MTVSDELTFQGETAVLRYGGLRCMLRAIASVGEGDHVSVGDALRSLGAAGIAGALLIPSLMALSPATAMFGVASLSGLAIAFLASQLILQREKLWLPRVVCRRSIKRSHLQWVERTLGPPLDWIEKRSRARLQILTCRPLGFVPALVAFVLGLSMPFLELVPMSATTIGASVTLMVVGLLLNDGLIVSFGLIVSGFVAWLVTSVATSVFSFVV